MSSPRTEPIAEPIAVDDRGRPLPLPAAGSPDWYRRALETLPDESRVSVDGADIELLTWGIGDGPGMLLVHGAGAHADWWRPTAPQLAQAAGRVAAFSFSGTGGSDWRSSYTMDFHVDELLGAAEAAGLFAEGRKPLLVAHSFGCLPAMIAADRHPGRFGGLVLIDLYLPPPDRIAAQSRERKPRRYESLAEARERFILSPPQDCPYPFIVDFIALRTLRRVDGPDETYWTWCTDPAASVRVPHDEHRTRLGRLTLPLALIRGECSRLVDHEVDAHVRSVAPAGTLHVEIPDADHHVLLDRPLALVAALRTLIATHGRWKGDQ